MRATRVGKGNAQKAQAKLLALIIAVNPMKVVLSIDDIKVPWPERRGAAENVSCGGDRVRWSLI